MQHTDNITGQCFTGAGPQPLRGRQARGAGEETANASLTLTNNRVWLFYGKSLRHLDRKQDLPYNWEKSCPTVPMVLRHAGSRDASCGFVCRFPRYAMVVPA